MPRLRNHERKGSIKPTHVGTRIPGRPQSTDSCAVCTVRHGGAWKSMYLRLDTGWWTRVERRIRACRSGEDQTIICLHDACYMAEYEPALHVLLSTSSQQRVACRMIMDL